MLIGKLQSSKPARGRMIRMSLALEIPRAAFDMFPGWSMAGYVAGIRPPSMHY